MDVSRRILMAAGSIALPIVLVSTIDVSTAWAANASGTISCSKVSGKVTFTPTIESTGDSNTETSKVSLTFTSCTVSRGTAPTKGTLTETIKTTSTNNSADACSTLAASRPATLKIVWTHTPAIGASTVKFSGDSTVSEPGSGDAGFASPNTGGMASVTGSYPGADGGKTSTLTVYSNVTALAIFAACAAGDGISSLTIDAGSLSLK
jgi:hypothetical protein